MHPLISVAVATRHRPGILESFITTYGRSLWKSVEKDPTNRTPCLTVLHDSPAGLTLDSAVALADDWHGLFNRSVWLPDKSSMTELWNMAIILSPTDWVLVCNDDIEFKPGWLEYLENTIATGKYDLIHLFHYGAFCIHKSMVLSIGWFDERFRFAGFEDNDFQLRISEAGIKDRVDRSHDFIRRDGGREVGHFVDHTKYVHNQHCSWGGSNEPWFKAKWGRESEQFVDWRSPFTRNAKEIDWHPIYSHKYRVKFGINTPPWISISEDSLMSRKYITI